MGNPYRNPLGIFLQRQSLSLVSEIQWRPFELPHAAKTHRPEDRVKQWISTKWAPEWISNEPSTVEKCLKKRASETIPIQVG